LDLAEEESSVDMAAAVNSFSVQQSPASEGTRPHRPFLLGVLFGALAVGGLVAVASLGRAEANFVAAPVGGASVDSGAGLRGVQQRAQAAGRATGPMMAADTQGNAAGDYLFPDRRQALATGAAGFAAGVGLLSGASEANAARPEREYSLSGDLKNIDVNSAYMGVYTMLPGFDEAAAKKIAANAPYKGLTDMYARAGFSEAEKTSVKNYEQRFLFGNPKAKYTMTK